MPILNTRTRLSLNKGIVRRGLIAQAIAILAKYGGSLYVAGPQYVAQGSDGAGSVSAGGAVGYVRDLVDGRHATQATGTRRPLLQLTAGRWGLKFDGTDDALLTGALATAAAETFGAVYTAPATASAAQYPISRRNAGSSVGSTLYINNVNFSTNFINAGGTVAAGAVIAAGVTGVLSAVGKAGSVAARVNGNDGTPVSYGSYTAGTNALALGNSIDLARAFGGALHAAYYAPAEISNTDRQALDRLLGRIFGVSVA